MSGLETDCTNCNSPVTVPFVKDPRIIWLDDGNHLSSPAIDSPQATGFAQPTRDVGLPVGEPEVWAVGWPGLAAATTGRRSSRG